MKEPRGPPSEADEGQKLGMGLGRVGWAGQQADQSVTHPVSSPSCFSSHPPQWEQRGKNGGGGGGGGRAGHDLAFQAAEIAPGHAGLLVKSKNPP